MRFLELKDVYQRIKRPETRLEEIIALLRLGQGPGLIAARVRLEEIIALLRQSLKPVENEAIKERVLSYVLYQEDLETSQKLLGTSSPTGCMGLAAVEAWPARAKDRLGRSRWSMPGIVDSWCILKRSEA